MSISCFCPQLLTENNVPNELLPLSLAYFVSNPDCRQLHVGFLFYGTEEVVKFGDVGFHNICGWANVEYDKNYYAQSLNLSDSNQQVIAGRIEALLDDFKDKLPYSVEHAGFTFKDGAWIGNEPGQGLTCATFVTEFLKHSGFPLVNDASWQVREGDADWKETMLLIMEKTGRGTAEHIQVQRDRLGSTPRVRPADVACAASIYIDKPIDFTDISKLSEFLEKKLLDETSAACSADHESGACAKCHPSDAPPSPLEDAQTSVMQGPVA